MPVVLVGLFVIFYCSEITIFLKLKKFKGGEGEYVRITRSINHGRTVK